MFTGIIEDIGIVANVEQDRENLHLTIQSAFAQELRIDQSVSHNGVCLTVVVIDGNRYKVTAIKETLGKSNIGNLKIHDEVNLERAMKLGDRLDGHIVQGHVDQTAICTGIDSEQGSWIYRFEYDPSKGNVTIKKGSITVNGVSLTVVDSDKASFSVAIIPYTYAHTNFKTLTLGSVVNLEFDVLGKYVQRLLAVGS